MVNTGGIKCTELSALPASSTCEPRHDKANKVTVRLAIRVFAVRLMGS